MDQHASDPIRAWVKVNEGKEEIRRMRTNRWTAAIAVPLLLVLGGCHIFQSSDGAGANVVVPSEPTDDQQARLAEAQSARDRGDYDVALSLLQEIIAENPTITPAYVAIGDIQLEQADFNAAESAYRRAARLDPGNFAAQFGHGQALQSLKRFADAVQAYLRALTINPDSVPANMNVARAYLELDRSDLARPFAEKAVQLAPDNGDARVTLAGIYDNLGMLSQSIDTYRVAMELIEPSPSIILNLVNVLSEADRFREAIDAARTLNRIEPNANAYERLGRAHFKLREYDESIAAYRQAVELDPSLWVAWNGIGVNALNGWLLTKRRDRELAGQAREAFRTSLRIQPDQPKIIQLLSTYQL